MKNRQSAAKSLSSYKEYEKGSTTIPEGSTDINIGKQPVYLKEKM